MWKDNVDHRISRTIDFIGDMLTVNGGQVCIFKQGDESIQYFLQGTDSAGLKAQVGLEVLRDFTNKSLERQLADQKLTGADLRAALVASCFLGALPPVLLRAS
ncbi:14535_t:CDS:2 [Acaulospora colombiana]|uniref:14535_t:CDS:1 n=1 Tax=Acaulospora colombiana TaxID=27376 RepID=A0ACA9KE09_9GLOM|nr:14535_t:CDS:2 [Acaulospora colombiana]